MRDPENPAPPSGPLSRFPRSLAGGPTRFVLATIALGVALRLVLAAAVGYGYGEAYYVATARRLALSYYDQPPLSLWTAWAAATLAGDRSPFVLRLPFVAISAATTWLMYRLGSRLFGAWAGAWAALLLNLSVVFTFSVASWVQPDGPLFLFLLAAALPLVHLLFERPARPSLLWAAAGAAFGLALLSKYHAALSLSGLGLFVMTCKDARPRLLNRGLVLAAALAALGLAPVLLWNAQNGWASFSFQGGRILEGSGLRPDWLVRSVAGQALLVSPFLWPPLVALLFAGIRRGPAEPKGWLLCCVAVVPIVLFTAAALWAPLGWHFHWQAPGYLFLFPLLGRAVAERLERGDRPTRRWLAASAGLVLFGAAVLATQATTGWMHGLLPRRLQAMPYHATNPTRELLEWKGLREALVARGLIPGDRLFAVAPVWYLTGKIDAEIGGDVPVTCFGADPRNIAFTRDPRGFRGWDAVIVTTDDPPVDPVAAWGPLFREVRFLGDVGVDLGSSRALTIHLHLGRGYGGQLPYRFPGR